MNTVEERFNLIKEVGTEILTSDDLKQLLTEKKSFVAYDGFEPSGKIHIAQGLLRVININKMIKSGAKFKMLVADWHGWANNKMGGDLEKIKVVGKYFIEVWKACGIDEKNVEFIWASDLVKDDNYWKLVLQIARLNTVQRIIRCSQIMGRSDADELSAAQIFYPCMQCADVFYMGIDVCQLGLDQRKVNVLAREVAQSLGYKKPIAVHHHMLMGLHEPKRKVAFLEELTLVEIKSWSADAMIETAKRIQPLFELMQAAQKEFLIVYPTLKTDFSACLEVFRKEESPTLAINKPLSKETIDAFKKSMFKLKESYAEQQQLSKKMSKSNPSSSIYMTDLPKDVEDKFKKAYCPDKQVADNPVLEYYKYIIFEKFDSVEIVRPEKFGGTLTFVSYADLENAYSDGKIHPLDLKATCAKYINELLLPVQDYFVNNHAAKTLKEQVDAFAITR